ncbi:MAG: 50S ribosomal protein L9, partial [candidate division Zixibacteria bacterium]|nr:50S ribosomal protein L9 [candidate division Zixibacteria bacterium]
MKIILREDLEDLGKCGEVIQVKDGYARNYLFPKNLAIPATKGNLRSINEVTR